MGLKLGGDIWDNLEEDFWSKIEWVKNKYPLCAGETFFIDTLPPSFFPWLSVVKWTD